MEIARKNPMKGCVLLSWHCTQLRLLYYPVLARSLCPQNPLISCSSCLILNQLDLSSSFQFCFSKGKLMWIEITSLLGRKKNNRGLILYHDWWDKNSIHNLDNHERKKTIFRPNSMEPSTCNKCYHFLIQTY